MDKDRDEVINKLIVGQEKMGKDIAEIKVDITGLKQGQQRLEADVSDLKQGQLRLEADVSVMKEDITGLKQDQRDMNSMMLKLLEEMTSLKKIVINIENDLHPKVKTLYDADMTRQQETAELKQTCREQEKRLDDHELRISRLEE